MSAEHRAVRERHLARPTLSRLRARSSPHTTANLPKGTPPAAFGCLPQPFPQPAPLPIPAAEPPPPQTFAAAPAGTGRHPAANDGVSSAIEAAAADFATRSPAIVPPAPVLHGVAGQNEPPPGATIAGPSPPGPALPAISLPGPALPAAGPAPQPAVAAAPTAAHPPPAHQLAPALIQLANGPSGSTITLRLDPAALGHVQVRIERDQSGAATVQVTAERAEALHALTAAQPQLHRALDSAGVGSEGRTIAFSLDPRQDAASQSIVTDNSSGGTFGSGSGAGGHRPGRPARGTTYGGLEEEPGTAATPHWLRAGVDITA